MGYPIIEGGFEGYNGTIFTYGGTATGKTFTMIGKFVPLALNEGMISQAFEHVFSIIREMGQKRFMLKMSMIELYDDEIRDLLVKEGNIVKLGEKPGGDVYLKDLTEIEIHSLDEIKEKFSFGIKNRSSEPFQMNLNTYRGHLIITLTIQILELGTNNQLLMKKSKLNFIRLAGQERLGKCSSEGKLRKLCVWVNKSLQGLNDVISGLVESKSGFVLYRSSKLTRLLQDSLGGNSQTVMIGTISPDERDYMETLSTLSYVSLARGINNKLRMNVVYEEEQMKKEFQEEILRFKSEILSGLVMENNQQRMGMEQGMLDEEIKEIGNEGGVDDKGGEVDKKESLGMKRISEIKE